MDMKHGKSSSMEKESIGNMLHENDSVYIQMVHRRQETLLQDDGLRVNSMLVMKGFDRMGSQIRRMISEHED